MEPTLKYLKEIFDEYYKSATDSGRETPICWSSTFVPCELLRALDIDIFYPESYAAVLSGRPRHQNLFHEAHAEGFSSGLCSYSRLFQGAIAKDQFLYGSLRKPDFLIGTNNQCGTIGPWWRNLAESLDIPIFMLDFPGGNTYSTRDYVRAQLDELIKFIEGIKGEALRPDKLKEIIKASREASNAWKEALALRKGNLSFNNIGRFMDFLFPIVVFRGKAASVNFYKAFYEEVKEESKKTKNSAQYKILWCGYPMWFLPSKVFPKDIDNAAFVIDNYTSWWIFDLDENNPLDSMAEIYNNTYLNLSLQERLDRILSLVNDFSIDGMVIHINKSCKRDAIFAKTVRDMSVHWKIPSVLIEADMCEADLFSGSRITEAVSLLVESVNIKNSL